MNPVIKKIIIYSLLILAAGLICGSGVGFFFTVSLGVTAGASAAVIASGGIVASEVINHSSDKSKEEQMRKLLGLLIAKEKENATLNEKLRVSTIELTESKSVLASLSATLKEMQKRHLQNQNQITEATVKITKLKIDINEKQSLITSLEDQRNELDATIAGIRKRF